MTKIKRSRTGCFNCKQRRRKCDETKPSCLNCVNTGRECGYGIRLSFDVDDSRHSNFLTLSNGRVKYGFRGRPRLVEPSIKNPIDSKKVDESSSINSKVSGPSLIDSSTSQIFNKSPMENKLSTPTFTGNNDSLKSFPMTAGSSLDNLSGSTAFEMLDSNQSTFEFINKGLDYLLNGLQTTESELKAHSENPLDTQPTTEPVLQSSVISIGDQQQISKEEIRHGNEETIDATEILSFIDNTNLYPSAPLSYSDENLVLRHFFNRLLPLLDSHPNNPWPELALQYCDFEIARSCFLSLSCIHLYGKKGGKEYYRTGMLHINSTMEYLNKYINSSGTLDGVLNAERKYDEGIQDDINVDRIVGDLREETISQKRSSFFVILLLIYVHILFSILESGKSVLSRIFFKLFSTIANDSNFKVVLEQIDQSQTCICILSWYDTITAVASPDCRLPYCDLRWYGTKNSEISLAKMVGCPGEIFECIARICQFRLDLKEKKLSGSEISAKYNQIKFDLINYREYVSLKLYQEKGSDESLQLKPEDEYDVRLRGAQCWALSALVKLESILNLEDSSERIETLINEFIMVYSSMDPECTTVVQMVWPIFNIGSECITEKQKNSLQIFINVLNKNGQTGTLRTLKKLLEESWRTGKKVNEILSGKEWLGSGTEFLPL